MNYHTNYLLNVTIWLPLPLLRRAVGMQAESGGWGPQH